MVRQRALLVMALVARRSSTWMHDIICNESISNGEVSDDAVERYVRDIKEALDIFTKDEGLRRG